jgi:hypothetical protein
MSRRIRAEHFWWLGVAAWVALVVLWRPEPPLSMLDAPSSSPGPSGYGILHDLLVRETAGVARVLERASQLAEEVDVLLVLSPGEEVPESHRREMMDWAYQDGKTLIIGHPVIDEEGSRLTTFAEEGAWPISEWSHLTDTRNVTVSYVAYNVTEPRDVPEFGHTFRGEMSLSDFGAEGLLLGDGGEVLATIEPYGGGTVIQLAEADLLDNRALGWKQTHLFAAALIDEVGRDKIWGFDEAHEGIEPEPSLISFLGAGRWRTVALQVLLLGLFFYWWRSTRLGRPATAPPREEVREVTTMARDIGDFYLRAGESRWALGRTLDYLRLALKERGAASEERARAAALMAEAEQELNRGTGGVERHAVLIRKMALSQKMMAESKGKRR